jgi:hypothetical protein
MPSRCPMPSENLPARLRATASRPVSAITSSTRRFGMPWVAAIARRWSRALRPVCTALASSSTPTSVSGERSCPYCEPFTSTRPDVGASRPTIMRIVVDLPAPFGPRNPVTVPGRTVKLTPSTAVLDPYLLVTFSATIMLRRYAGSSVVASAFDGKRRPGPMGGPGRRYRDESQAASRSCTARARSTPARFSFTRRRRAAGRPGGRRATRGSRRGAPHRERRGVQADDEVVRRCGRSGSPRSAAACRSTARRTIRARDAGRVDEAERRRADDRVRQVGRVDERRPRGRLASTVGSAAFACAANSPPLAVLSRPAPHRSRRP